MDSFDELVSERLLGYMATEDGCDEFVWLFLGKADDVNVVCFEQAGSDGYRDSEWQFNPNPETVPVRDSKYKAIGEVIRSIIKGEEYDKLYFKIRTDTKIIVLTTDSSDCYYPYSIWDVI